MRLARAQRTTDTIDARADAELVELATVGDSGAFEELYRRHAAAAWRVAQAVVANPDDASDAVADAFTRVFSVLPAGRLHASENFRPYVLAATRNAALDLVRRGGRLESTDRMERLDIPTNAPGPSDRATQGAEAVLVAEAFRSLPERWRSVLWMTEVEGIPVREVGVRLGMRPNTAAQLAGRARAGLRERYLQAHLRNEVPTGCRHCVERLGAYVAGRLAPRDLAKVDQHLAGCAECRKRREELEDVRGTLRLIVLPLPLLLGPAALQHWRNVASVGPASAGTASGSMSPLMAKAHKPLLALSTGIFALGVISASVIGSPDAALRDGRRGAFGLPPTVPSPAEVALATSTSAFGDGLSALGPFDFATEDDANALPAPHEGAADTCDVDCEGETAAPAPPPVKPEPLANVAFALKVGPLVAGLSLGAGDGSCTGGSVGTTGNCAPPQTSGSTAGVTIVTDGSLVPPLNDKSVSVGL